MRIIKTTCSLFALAALSSFSMTAFAEETVCRGTIGARSLDNVIVPENASCTLQGTKLKGTLKVSNGASLQANAANINGNVQAEGALNVKLTDSQIGGSIQIKQGGAASINTSWVKGDIQFDENLLPLSAYKNTVGGSIQVMKNSGGAALNGNIIDGNLQCKENAPAPVGSGNRATSKEDQCASL
jgi:hypothetical protein